ncbi:MAG: type I restriction enzyme S subunit [Paraglaciecola sp.]|jgi:type I restriction enzyme S subunit
MSEWHDHRLGDNVSPLSGFPFSSSAFSNENGFPLIRIRDLLDGKTELKYSGKFEKSYVIKADDVLIGMDGDFHLVKWKGQEALLNQRILKLIENRQSELCLDFLFYWLAPFLIKVNEQTAATTVKHLSTFDVVNAIVHAPAYEQQEKIAKILSTVDSLIGKTQSLIDKYTAVKQGMMADLFTRGIDLTPGDNYGQLRPSATEAPELYQQTELGWVPKDWEVLPLQKLAQKIQDGTHFSPVTGSGDYLYLTSKNIRFGYLTLENIETISKEQHISIHKRCDVRKGDLLLTKDGANTGNAAINDIAEQFSMLSSVAFIRSNELSKEDYLLHYILSDIAQSRIKDAMSGNAITRLTLEKINSFTVPVPPITEQRLITDKLNALKNTIDDEKIYLEKLKLQKKGLMQDLLTGKVRV